MNPSQSDAVDFGPFLTNSFGDRYLHSVNRNVFNQEGSDALYKKKFKNSFQRKDCLGIFLGSDSGLLLQYCLKQELPTGSSYVFIELPEVQALLDKNLLQNLPPQITVLSYDEFWEKQESFRFNEYILAQRANVYTSFCVEDGHIFDYRTIETHFRDTYKKTVADLFISIGVDPFVDKAIANLCDNRVETTKLRNCFAGRTGVVLGGGPSLDTILPWLKKHQDQVVIFAVARICQQLWQEGIVPHVIVAVDPQEHIFEFCKEMLFFSETSIFIHSFHASTSLISQWGGLSTYTGSRVPWPSKLNNDNEVSTGSTVTNLALGLTGFTGCSQTILGGVDFCFSREGFSHASGSDEYIAGPNLLNTIPIETNSGEFANTRPDYYRGMKDMEKQAKSLVQEGLHIINPSPDSARIEHVEFLPLDQLTLPAPGQHPLEIIRGLLPVETSETRDTYYRLVRKELQRQHEKIRKFNKLIKEALKCNAGLFGRKGMQADFKYKIRMDEIEEKLKKDYEEIYAFVRIYNLRELLQTTTTRSEEDNWSDREIEEFGQKYYQVCLKSAHTLIAQLNTLLKTVEIRLAEENKSPKIRKLVQFWQKNNQHGRAKIWREQHPELWQKLGKEEQTLLLDTEKTFTEILQRSDTEYQQMRRKAAPLAGLATNAVSFFRAKDEKALARLIEGLRHHPDTDKAERLVAFATGLQYELAEDVANALEQYNTLISDEADFLTEDTLRRIFQLSLDQGKYDDALLAADCLTGLSITYAPFLAKLYELGNDKAQALDIYTRYIEQVGLDSSVLLKMAHIYTDLGIDDGARLMYTTILEQDPENKAALNFLSQNTIERNESE